MKRSALITDVFDSDLVASPVQMYMSGDIQVPDIIEFLLEFTGPAEVFLSSFSISEEFLRRLFFLRKKKIIRHLEVMLDFKATQKTLILWPFIAQTVENCYLADNHSKLLVVKGDKTKAAVTMSQNLTRGNRFECGALCTLPHIVDSVLSQYLDIRNNLSVPFNEIYRGRVDSD